MKVTTAYGKIFGKYYWVVGYGIDFYFYSFFEVKPSGSGGPVYLWGTS
jgi:hypothetical protein